jgi:hypothetical protein
MYLSVVPGIVADVAPRTLISVGNVVISDAAFPYVPALHVQLLAAELAFGELEFAGHVRHVDASVAFVLVEYVPAAQSTHAALPALVLYFPGTHATHGPPSGPVNPALQAVDTHALTFELPLGEVVPTGHVRHCDENGVKYLMMTTPEPPFFPEVAKPHPPPPPPVPGPPAPKLAES